MSRRRRKLLILLSGVAVVGLALAAFVGLLSVQRLHLAEQARARGLAAHESGEYVNALKELTYAVSRNLDDLDGLMALADSRSRVFEVNSRHLIAAVQHYKAALRLDPDNFRALTGLLDLYWRLGYGVEVVNVAERILALAPDHVDAMSATASFARRRGQYDEAVTIYRRLGSLEPDKLWWRWLHIKALQAGGADKRSILDLCDQWIANYQGDGRLRLVKAQVLVDLGDFRAAEDELRVATTLGAESKPILEGMLSVLDQLNLRDLADKLLAKVKYELPREPWVYEAVVRQKWRSLRLDEALAELERAEKAMGQLDHRLLRWKALLAAATARREEANAALDALLVSASSLDETERDGARAWAQAIRAWLDVGQGGWLEGVEAYEGAATLVPQDPVLQYLCANAYQRIGEHDVALMILDRAADREAGWLALDLARVESLLALNRPRDALETMSRVVRRNPSRDLGAYVLLCRAWFALGEAGDEIRLRLRDEQRSGGEAEYDLLGLLHALHTQTGWNAQITPMLGETYLRKGRPEDTKALIERALDDTAADPRIMLSLAHISQQWGLRLQQDLTNAARDRMGLTPAVVVAQARILQRQGELEEALDVIDGYLAPGPLEVQGLAELEWLRAQLLLETGRADAASEILRMVQGSKEPQTALAILDLEEVWKDPTLVRSIIDHLADALGGRSSRVMLAEAAYLQRYAAHDPGDWAKAIINVRAVLTATPDSRSALLLMASLEASGDEPQIADAIRHLRQVIDLYPQELIAYQRLIGLLQHQGDFETARTYLDRLASRGDGGADTRRIEVRLLEAQGDFERAAQRLEAMSDGTSPSDQLWLASLSRRAGDQAGAEAVYERLLADPSSGLGVVAAAADFYSAIGRFEEGLALLKSRLAEESEALRSLSIGHYLLQSGFLKEAEPYLIRAAELEPESAQVGVDLANLYIARGDLLAARDAAQRGLKLQPDNASLKAMLALMGIAAGEEDQQLVQAALQELGEENPALERILALYDRVSAPRVDDLAQAKRLVRDYPLMMPAWRVAIILHVAAQNWDEAIRLAIQAVARLPADPAPAELATRLLIERGRADKALNIARVWRHRSREAPLEADTLMAALFLDLEHPGQAVEQLSDHAARIWSERDRFAYRLQVWLKALFASGEREQALALLSTLLGESASWRETCLEIAPNLKQPDAEAVLCFVEPYFVGKTAGRLRMSNAWCNFARAYEVTWAYEHAAKLISNIPEDSELAFSATIGRALIATGLGKLEEAEALYRSLLERGGRTSPMVLSNLAVVIVRRGTRCDEAVALARRAAELAVDDPRPLDTLAQALFCAGDHAEAEQQIRRALGRQPANPQWLVTLAGILHAQGRDVQARAELESARRVLRRRPDSDLARRIDSLMLLLTGSASSAPSEASAGSGDAD